MSAQAALAQTPALDTLPVQRTTAGGLEFHYVEQGQGLPLVFMHGVLGDYRTAAPQWSAFAPRYRCISYSRRYNWPNENTSLDPDHSALTEARDLKMLLEIWNAAPAILVASSYGAFTALALAVDSPHLVRALVLAEPPMLRWADRVSGGHQARQAFERDVREPARQAFQQGDDAAAVMRLTGGIVGAGAMAVMDPLALQRRLVNARSIKALTLSSDEFPMLAPDRVRALQCPVLLMAGIQTPTIHDTVFRALCAEMPQAEAVRVPHAGHGVARDNPAYFNQRVLDFLATHIQ
jgi:pimeloyl-ACP methyl ester carboxylesterase